MNKFENKGSTQTVDWWELFSSGVVVLYTFEYYLLMLLKEEGYACYVSFYNLLECLIFGEDMVLLRNSKTFVLVLTFR